MNDRFILRHILKAKKFLVESYDPFFFVKSIEILQNVQMLAGSLGNP